MFTGAKLTMGRLGQIPLWLRWLSICLQCGKPRFDPWVRKFPWRRKWQPTPVFLPGKSHGQRSPVSYSPWGHKELDTTERLHFTSLQTCNGSFYVSTLLGCGLSRYLIKHDLGVCLCGCFHKWLVWNWWTQ